MDIIRQIAYKVWIASLLASEYVKGLGEFDPNYVSLEGLHVSRVNIIASVIDVFKNEEKGYMSIRLDDGSGVIPLKAWKDDFKLLAAVTIGELVLVIGKIKKFNEELYITPEIVRVVEPSWGVVRKKELQLLYGEVLRIEPQKNILEEVEEEVIERVEDVSEIEVRNKLLKILSTTEEMSIPNLVQTLKLTDQVMDKLIKNLLQEGEIYQSRPGFLKIV